MLERVRFGVLVFLALAVPVVFDPHTSEVFNIPKYTVLVVGALILAATYIVEVVQHGRIGGVVSDLNCLLAVFLLWDLLSALAGVDVRLSLLGAYGSYDGFFAAATFAVVAVVAARQAVRSARHVIVVLALGAGGLVSLYGLIQVHDRLFPRSHWDPVTWTRIPVSNVFSTLGNPNHLAGFLSVVLPSVVVLAVHTPRPGTAPSGSAVSSPQASSTTVARRSIRMHLGTRVAACVICVAMLIDLVQTGARGGWIAALLGTGVTGVVLLPELRGRLGRVLLPAAAVVAAAVAAVAIDGRKLLGTKFHHLFAGGGSSSVHQRLMLWQTGLTIAAHHPVAGTGPDTFSVVFPRYEPAAWSKLIGSILVANGAHNLFVNTIADQGFVGLLVLVSIVAFVSWLAVSASRRLRSASSAASQSDEGGSGTGFDRREVRFLVAAVSGGLAAYLVQAMFDTQQIAVEFCFWLLLGILVSLASAAGIPARSLVDRILPSSRGKAASLARTRRSGGSDGGGGRVSAREAARGPAGTNKADRGRKSSSTRRAEAAAARAARARRMVAAGLVAAVSSALVVFLAVATDRVWRADHDDWAWREETTAAAVANTHGDSAVAEADATGGTALARSAIALNPWEPQYPGTLGAQLAAAASGMQARSEEQFQAYYEASIYLGKAVSDSPSDAYWRFIQAQVLVDLANFGPSNAASDRSEARALAAEAIGEDPRDAAYTSWWAQNFGSRRRPPSGT